jgi:hypothetical protein
MMKSLRVAAELEKQFDPFIGPPERVFASELIGAELVAQGKGAEAVPYFETILRLCPGRTESVRGLAAARESLKR